MHAVINGTLLEKRVKGGTMYTPNVGELKMLTSIVTFEDIYLNLIMTNRTPVEGDVYTDYISASATGGGYAQITLTKTADSTHWVIATDVNGNAVAAYYGTQTFSFTGALTTITDKPSCATYTTTTVDVPNVTSLIVGDLITGTDIPTGTYITALGTTSITISQAATGTHSSLTMTFSHQIWGAVLIGKDTNTLYRVIKATSSWAPTYNGDHYDVVPQLSLKESTT